MMAQTDPLTDLCTACWLGEVYKAAEVLRLTPLLDLNQCGNVAHHVTQWGLERAAQSEYSRAMAERQRWPSNWKASTKARHRRYYNESCAAQLSSSQARARELWAPMQNLWATGMPNKISPLGWAIAGSLCRQGSSADQLVRLLLEKGANAHFEWGNNWTAYYLALTHNLPVLPLLPLPEQQIVNDLISIARAGDVAGARITQLIQQYGQATVKAVANNAEWPVNQHPLVLAALGRDELLMQRLLETGVTADNIDQGMVDQLAVSNLAKELLRGHDPTPPALVFPGSKLVATYKVLVHEQWMPQLEGGNAAAIEEYVLVEEGELPAGLVLDAVTGCINGTPTVVCKDVPVSIVAKNKLRQGPICQLQITVTSDLAKVLYPTYAEFAPTILKQFPTIEAFKQWCSLVSQADLDNALDKYLEQDVGVHLAIKRMPLKSLLRAQLAPPVPEHDGLGFTISPEDVQLDEVIGAGGQALVRKARWNGTIVAAKLFRFGSVHKEVKKAQKDLDREIRALTLLRHIHIVHMYGYFVEPAQTVLVIEFCPDGELGEYCAGKPLSTKLGLVGQVLSALAYLHSQQPTVVHGDIKPGNVLVSNGIAKLADFGLCTGTINAVSSSIGQSTFMGTAAYMAPENFEFKHGLNPAADIYSMGVLLWEIIEEEAPWKSCPIIVIMKQVADGVRPPVDHSKWSPELLKVLRSWWSGLADERPNAVAALKSVIRIESAIRLGVCLPDDEIEVVAAELNSWETEALALEAAKRESLAAISFTRRQLLQGLQARKQRLSLEADQQIADAQNQLLELKSAAEAELANATAFKARQEAELQQREEELRRGFEQRKQEIVEEAQKQTVKLSLLDESHGLSVAELEAKREELAAQPLQCCICFDDVPALEGVRCQHPDVNQRHFVCTSCFSEHVRHSTEHDIGVVEGRNGKVICPWPDCKSPPYKECVVYMFAGDAAVAAYQKCQDRLNEKRVVEQLLPSIRKELEIEMERSATMSADAQALHRARSHIVDRILTPACPACGLAFIDFDGCCALTCGGCRRGFCAYCLADCGRDAHDHVARCAFGVGTFAEWDVYERCRRNFRTSKVVEYMQTHVEERLHEQLLAACHHELADLGLQGIADRLNG